MKRGYLLATVIFAVTILLVAIGTLWPSKVVAAYSGGANVLRRSTTPEAAVENLGTQIRNHSWRAAYASLANKAEFSEQEFEHDITGFRPSLRTDASLENVDVRPLHESDTEANVEMRLHWSSVVGLFQDTRELHLVKNGDTWQVDWPLMKETVVPPQVIPVNYLRWDVIYRGPGDDWGAQDVESPHIRVVDMHPMQRAEGVAVLGELLNEDVVPAFVSVKATLIGKDGKTMGSEGSFDKISSTLLPKQVTPFFINFPNAMLSDVGSIRLDPTSQLVPASADPVIEVANQKLNPAPNASLTGQVVNESGEVVNIVHILTTLYDKTGQVVWIADQYTDRALMPQTPVDFTIHIPEDLAKKISSERTITASYVMGGV